jgi:triosephosphate isomerase
MRPIVGTSWKMHLTPTEAQRYLARLRPLLAGVTDRELFVLPPFPAIFVARDVLTGSGIGWGAQDVHPDDEGAHTGDVSAPMLADLGCRYVEVGHSERRRDHGETAVLIAAKVDAVLRWMMTPIVCVGEVARTTSQDGLASTLDDLSRVVAHLGRDDLARLIVAYEPVWAIGAGASVASPEHIATVHRGLSAWLLERAAGGPAARVIYGGSVDERVAGRILGLPGVDGLFVGRRALDAERFAQIARTPVIDS